MPVSGISVISNGKESTDPLYYIGNREKEKRYLEGSF